MTIVIPHSVLAVGWIPFAVVLVLTFIFAWIYVRLFQHHELSEVSSTLTAVLGLFVALLTSAVVPVDVFLISYMKNSNGTFKSWAADNSTRQSIELTVTYTYYTLYSVAALFLFILLPFMYFYYEEKDDEDVSTKQRCCTSFKYTLVFLLAAIIILLVGAFVPLKTPPGNYSIENQFHYLEDQLERYTHADQAISVFIGVLSMFGMLSLLLYTGFGLSALPLSMIRCGNRYKDDSDTPTRNFLTRKERDDEKARALRAKSRAGRNLTRFERNEMKRIEEDERLQTRLQRKKEKLRKTTCGKIFLSIFKPFEVVFGVVLLVLSLVMISSLIITSVEKLEHSLGPKSGYTLPSSFKSINFCDKIMMLAQKVFPLDYILMTLMVLFFVFASMSGLKKMGIWCCCIKMFKIRAGKTMPQALLFMVFLLMLIVMALNIVLLTLTPQYMQYGNQQYWQQGIHNETSTLVQCSTSAPEGECTMSRFAMLSSTLFYKAWIFGAFYYWCIWGLSGIYVLCLLYNIYNVCRTRADIEMLDSDDESDEESLIKA